MSTPKPVNRYLELDALRGIAVLLVGFFHFTRFRPEGAWGFKFGSTGVDLFFIISGFVIFMSLQKITKGVEFAINRVSRLYPTYWTAITFTFLTISAYALFKHKGIDKTDLINYVGNLTMFQFYLNIPNLDGAYWTMIIEMLFYIVMLILFSLNALRYVVILGLCISGVTVIGYQLMYDIELVKRCIEGIPLLKFLPLFTSGIIFYKIYTDNKHRLQRYLALGFCLVCQILLFNASRRFVFGINNLEYGITLIFYYLVFTLLSNHKLSFIISRATLLMGKISFAFYLIHESLSQDFLLPFFADKLHINFWIAAIFITFPIITFIATAITYFIEIPLGKKMKSNLRTLFKVESPSIA